MMRSGANAKAPGKENSLAAKKKRVNDRRGVSEIKRSEAALQERNDQLVSELDKIKSNAADAIKEQQAMAEKIADLERRQSELQDEMLNADERHFQELQSEKANLLSEMEAEKEKLESRIEAMSGALESLGHDPVTMEAQLAKKEGDTAEFLDEINTLVNDVDISTNIQQETCAQILEQLEGTRGDSSGECPTPTMEESCDSPDIY